MKRFVVLQEYDGVRVERYLCKVSHSFTKAGVYKLMRMKKIRCNGTLCKIGDHVASGDQIDVFVPVSFFEKDDGASSAQQAREDACNQAAHLLQIVYEDENLLVLNKPKGILSQKDHTARIALDELINAYLKRTDSHSPKVGVVGRLDYNTSGLVLSAKHLPALRELEALSRHHAIKKHYLVLTKGVLPRDGLYETYALKDKPNNKVHCFSAPRAGAYTMQSVFRALQVRDGYSLLLVRLLTGKPHQIRAQLAFLGLSVLGDVKYGDGKDPFPISSQMLSCVRLSFPYANQNSVTFTCMPDEEFLSVAERLRFPRLTSIDSLVCAHDA